MEKLDYHEKIKEQEEMEEQKEEDLEALRKRMQDPSYVPTFEELMRVKNGK